MRLILLLGAMLLALCTQVMTADDRCGGVMMATRSSGSHDHKTLIQKLGFYSTDGGLVMNGESTCTSIHIECERTNGICRIATAVTNSFLGPGQVFGIFMSDDYKITEWTKDVIRAEIRTVTTPGEPDTCIL
jgi:hypothetical protein